MCGIGGFLSFDGVPDVDLVRRMLGRLHHRGPDGSGYYRDRRIALGHSRLSIIDLSAAPSRWRTRPGPSGSPSTARSSTTSSCAPSCGSAATASARRATPRSSFTPRRSGARRRSSASTASGRSRSGTPRRSGSSSPRPARRAAALLSRAPGRPCCSPARSRRSSPTPRSIAALDPAGLDEVFTFWTPVAPRTVFAGVAQVPPGHYVVVDADGDAHRAVWQMRFPAARRRAVPGPRGERRASCASARARPTLACGSCAPTSRSGAYLSGGLDSSVTTSVIASVRRAPCRRSRCASTTPSSTKAATSASGRALWAPSTTRSSSRQPTSRRSSPTSSATPRRPLLRTAPAPLYLLSRARRRRTATRSCSPAKAPTRCSPATTSSARPGAAVLAARPGLDGA